MSEAPWVGLSLMPTDDFRAAALPLFAEGQVEGLQWSFDTADEVDWSSPLLDAYEEAGRLSGHGVFLGMLSGQWSERQENWIAKMQACAKARSYARISEHWGFTSAGDFGSGAPLPIPFTSATLALAQSRMHHFSRAAQRPVGLENLAFAFSAIDALAQGSFLDGILREVDGFVLLDLHNLYCQVENFGIDPVVLLESYPLDLVQELHVSGGSTSQRYGRRLIRRDTHDSDVPEAVFDMTRLALHRCPNVKAVILERLGGTIRSEESAETFRADFRRVLKIRDEVCGSEPFETDKPAPAEPGGSQGAPQTDEALAAFQGRLLATLYEQSSAEEIMATLRRASDCQEFLPYLDTFDPAMVEVAALLTKKWARREAATGPSASPHE